MATETYGLNITPTATKATAPVATAAPPTPVAATAPSQSETYTISPQPVSTRAATETYALAPQAVSTRDAPVPATAPAFNLTGPTVSAATAIYHDAPVPNTTVGVDTGAPEFENYDPSGAATYGAYSNPIDTPEALAAYLGIDYASVATGPVDMTQYMPSVNGRTSFDYQREQVAGQFESEAERQLEQLDAYLASQGITGAAAVQARNQLQRDISIQRAMAMTDVNRQEASYMQEAAMTEQGQRFSREERLGEQAFTADLTYAQLNQREREASETARQYDNKMDFDAWAAQQGFTENERNRAWQAMQNDENRRLTAAELQTKVDEMRNDLAFQYEQLNVTTGVERDQILAQIHNNEADLRGALDQISLRAYTDRQLATLESDLTQERWVDQQAITQRQQSYFNRGKAGEVLDDAQLEALRTQDPLAYYAYLDGRAGLEQAVFDANMDLRTSYLETSMGALAELTGADFIAAMSDIWAGVNDLFREGGAFSSTGLIPNNPNNPPKGGRMQVNPPEQSAPVSVFAVPASNSGVIRATVPQINPLTGQAYPLASNSGSHPSHTMSVGNTQYSIVHYTYPDAPNTVGSTVMYRGNASSSAAGDAYASPTVATYQPAYTFGSPEATGYVDGILNTGPYQAVSNQYTYDSATLDAALQKTMESLGTLPPVTIPVYDGSAITSTGYLSPQFALGYMMQAAGRAIQTESGEIPLNSPDQVTVNERVGFPPVDASNMPLIDTEYMNELATSGNAETLRSLAFTYANIGGYPYAIIPSYDPLSGEPTDGVMAVSLHNPMISIRWEV